MTIKSKGNQVFNIPNNSEGELFVEQCAKFLNRPQYGFLRRGRGSRKESGSDLYIPLKDAEWVAMYIEDKIGDKAKEEEYSKTVCDLVSKNVEFLDANRNLDETVDRLHDEVGELMNEKSELVAERDAYLKELDRLKGDFEFLSAHNQRVGIDSEMKIGDVTVKVKGATSIEVV